MFYSEAVFLRSSEMEPQDRTPCTTHMLSQECMFSQIAFLIGYDDFTIVR